MTDNETVTISAEYFAKLHRLANESINICKECREEHTAEEFNAIVKERDGLKAKLAEAEWCINDIEKKCDCKGLTFCEIMDIIRAYREAKKEAAQ